MSNKRVRSEPTEPSLVSAKRCKTIASVPSTPRPTSTKSSENAVTIRLVSPSSNSKTRDTLQLASAKIKQLPLMPQGLPPSLAQQVAIDALEIDVCMKEATLLECDIFHEVGHKVSNAVGISDAPLQHIDAGSAHALHEKSPTESRTTNERVNDRAFDDDMKRRLLCDEIDDKKERIQSFYKSLDQQPCIAAAHVKFIQDRCKESVLQVYDADKSSTALLENAPPRTTFEVQLRAQQKRKTALMKEIQTSDIVLELCVV